MKRTRAAFRPHRRGASLVETLTAMTIGSVVVGIAASLVGGMLHLSRQGQRQLEDSLTLARLAGEFRNDVHAAARVERLAAEGQAGPGVRLVAPAHSVQYRSVGAELQRVETRGGAVHSRQHYRLPRESVALFSGPEAETDGAVRLTVAPAAAVGAPRRDLVIEAWPRAPADGGPQ
jgi:type II secretory pathway component PulJ